MATLFLDCVVRATLVATGTAVVLRVMRIKSAATRHAAWTAVVIAMLLLPVWSIAGLRLPVRILQPAPTAVVTTPDTSVDPALIAQERDAAVLESVAAAAPTSRFDAFDILIAVYVLVAGVLLARLAVGTALALRLRRAATVQSGITTSTRCATPITIGWLRPVALLPAVWPQWPEAQLRAVLTHEGEHVRRRDPLVQWLALLNRAVFWFHPIAWWLERRLSALAEEACDAAVLAAGYSPEDYSGYLLELARSVAGQRHRVHIGMAMIGSGLTTRVRRILEGTPASRISRARMVVAIALCVTSSAIFAAGTLASRGLSSQGVAASKPRFDVASVKPCVQADAGLPQRGGRGAGAPSQPSGSGTSASPGRMFLHCETPESLIELAYLGHIPRHSDITGGPGWMKSDRYDIEAVTAGAASDAVLHGPMLQALLEDRFKLNLHRETRDTPVYTLTTAKGGSKLLQLPEGACASAAAPKPTPANQMPKCGDTSMQVKPGAKTLAAHGMTIADYARLLTDFAGLDHPVIDKTGLSGVFDFQLQFAMDSTSGDPDMASIITAVQEQLGLKLDVAKAPAEFLVIDHVERPTPNFAASAATSGKPNVPASREVRR